MLDVSSTENGICRICPQQAKAYILTAQEWWWHTHPWFPIHIKNPDFFILLSPSSKQHDIISRNCEQINAKHKTWKQNENRKSDQTKKVFVFTIRSNAFANTSLRSTTSVRMCDEKVRWNRKFEWCAVIKSRQKNTPCTHSQTQSNTLIHPALYFLLW